MLTGEMILELNRAEREGWPIKPLSQAKNGDPMYGVRWLITDTAMCGIWYGSLFVVANGFLNELILEEFLNSVVDAEMCRKLDGFIREWALARESNPGK